MQLTQHQHGGHNDALQHEAGIAEGHFRTVVSLCDNDDDDDQDQALGLVLNHS